MRLAFLATLLFNLASNTSASTRSGSVDYDSNRKSYTLRQNVLDKTSVAWGTFEDTLNTTGWGVLNIRTSRTNQASDAEQHYAAGMLEGYLTANEIYPHYINNYGFTFKDKPPQKEVVAFLAEQEAWTKTSISQGVNSTFWQHIGAIQAQFEGLIAGYGLAAKAGKVPTIDRFGFQMLNAIGDLFQITPAVVPGLRKDWGRMNRETLRTELRKAGHCSGLIKVTGGFEDLFMAHSSWFEYANTNRIFKCNLEPLPKPVLI